MRTRLAVLVVCALTAEAWSAPSRDRVISQLRPAGSRRTYQGGRRCGPTSMAMAARSVGEQRWNDMQLIGRLDSLDGKINEGTTAAALQQMASRLGLRSTTYKSVRSDWLARKLRRGAI